LFFLFKISRTIGNEYQVSLFVVAFAATSPVFAYYQAGFLPGIPALTSAIIGVYFYIKHLKSNKNIAFYYSVIFISLASLIRTTFVLAYLSVLLIELFSMHKKRKFELNKLLAFAIGIAAIAAYFVYNNHLRQLYGSMFLNKLLPPATFEEALDFISISASNWFFHYFTLPHYCILLVLVFSGVYLIIKKGFYPAIKDKIMALSIVYLFACFCFSIAMMQQFMHHDYYFIDSFFLPILLLLAYMFSKSSMVKNSFKFFIIPAIFIVFFLVLAKAIDNKREESGFWDRSAIELKNFRNSAHFLDSIHIAKDAKIMVVDASTTNIPFILMGRKGYNSMGCSRSFFELSWNWDYNFLVAQDEFILSDIYHVFPEFIHNFQKIADNGYISVFIKLKKTIDIRLEEFLGIDKSKVKFGDSINFDGTNSFAWQNTKTAEIYNYSGKKCGFMASGDEFGLTFKYSNLKNLNEKSCVVKFNAMTMSGVEMDSGCNLVVSVTADGKNVYYQLLDISADLGRTKEWKEIEHYFILPKISSKPFEIGIYFWNPGKNELYYDDASIEIY
jgi:hypothetical protein